MPERSPLAEALAKLDAAMRPLRGSSADPERRRVAARLADLARCEDDELAGFATRHLPGRAVDEPALRAAREMILAIGRVLGLEGESAEALVAIQDARRALDDRLAEAKLSAARREAEAAAATTGAPALVEASGPLSSPVSGLPFVAAPASMAVPAPASMAVPAPAPMAVPAPASMAVPAPAPMAVPAPAPMAVPAPAPMAVPAPAPMAVPAPAPALVPASGPRAEPPSSRTEPPSSRAEPPASRTEPPSAGAEPRPLGKTLPEAVRLVGPALPFTPVASDERQRPAVARFDAALPFQPAASDGTPSREPPPAAHHGSAAPSSHHERPLVAAGPSAPPVPAPSIPPAAAPSASPASGQSVPPPSSPAPASAGDPLSMRSPPPLTLNQYAGLVVACELYPAYVESTHARYGVPTPAARAALDAFWASRLAADPALAQRWPELCEAARRYFLQSR
ncbi:hypothetical protein WMF30_33025 [Sorangium sp. So ce134]